MDKFLKTAISAALEAGEEILHIYGTSFESYVKSDHSPLTEADLNSHRIISEHLKMTGLPVMSEEGKHVAFEERKKWGLYWLVDPLDGTKEFIKRNGEFTVNIALIDQSEPVSGVVYAPVPDVLYFGITGFGAFRLERAMKHAKEPDSLERYSEKLPLEGPSDFTVIYSRSHNSPETEAIMDRIRDRVNHPKFVSRGSSLKLCMIAEGSARFYPRLGPTMEWDTAAGHGIITAAGGKVVEYPSLRPLQYNKPELLNPWFMAYRDDIPGMPDLEDLIPVQH